MSAGLFVASGRCCEVKLQMHVRTSRFCDGSRDYVILLLQSCCSWTKVIQYDLASSTLNRSSKMSEHWKSTPRYWCKHCACYVRDTKLERQNHEATGRHQGALKRFLRDLHRGHEREERDKERARQEVARLNGVVPSSSSTATSSVGLKSSQPAKSTAPSESQLKRQREQLAELGVAMPSDVRPEMAIPGEWSVTNVRVIETKNNESEGKVEARASGVRKREVTEEQKEEEEAVQGLFKKPRRWGRDSKQMPQDEDRELDALLGGSIFTKTETAGAENEIKKEDPAVEGERKIKGDDPIKQEPDESTQGLNDEIKPGIPEPEAPLVKEEADMGSTQVVFKKRKPKNIRQK